MTFDSGILERGMLVSGEVWPTIATMEALCVDAGLTRAEFKSRLEEITTALKKWPLLAKRAGLSVRKIQEIRDRFRLIQSRIG